MRTKNKARQEPATPPSFIVEVEGYEGEDGRIVVANDRANGSARFGVPDKIYCIAEMDEDGVIRFNDWGYATAEEAIHALGGRPVWSLATDPVRNSAAAPKRLR